MNDITKKKKTGGILYAIFYRQDPLNSIEAYSSQKHNPTVTHFELFLYLLSGRVGNLKTSYAGILALIFIT